MIPLLHMPPGERQRETEKYHDFSLPSAPGLTPVILITYNHEPVHSGPLDIELPRISKTRKGEGMVLREIRGRMNKSTRFKISTLVPGWMHAGSDR